MRNCRSILIVEDDEAIRNELMDVLQDEGYSVDAVTNGQEALDYLDARKPEHYPGYIILDLMMPVMTGKEFLDHLKVASRKHMATIPIIVATAKGNPRIELVDPGAAVARLRKPFDLDEIFAIIKTHCGEPDQGDLEKL